MRIYDQKIVHPLDWNYISKKLREFFDKDYIETHIQSRLSILAACEDPATLRSFDFAGFNYPLPQTGQMGLEGEILRFGLDGVYCFTTSYRDEPNPIEGRHDKIFPMFEFEHKGNFMDLVQTLKELSVHLGFIDSVDNIPVVYYEDMCRKYNTDTLEAEHEALMQKDFGDVIALIKFPERTSPFFNMKYDGDIDEHTGEKLFNKCDFIICGIETFGSAERSCNVQQMNDSFHTISDGMYAKLLYNQFSKERVEDELRDFLDLPMISRFGGGIGITRLIRALKLKNII